MANIPGVVRIIEELETLPNNVLQAFYSEGAVHGINRFGKRVKPPKEVLELVALELKERNEEGIYIFESRAEKARLKPVGIRDPKVDPLCV